MEPTDLDSLVREHLKALVLFASQWDDAAAEDLVHDAFVRLAERVRDETPPENPVKWLYCVVRNAGIDRVRRKQQASKHAENYARENYNRFVSKNQTEDMIDGRILGNLLQQLPLEQREVIVAHLWGGLPFRDVAEVLGRPFSTVRREFHKGLETLRSQLRFDNSNHQ